MVTEGRDLRSVLRYFKSGKLSPDEVFSKFKQYTGYHDKRLRLRYAAVAATVLLLVGIGITYALRSRTIVLEAGHQQQTIVLSDGTEVILAPHAMLSYQKNDVRSVSISGKAFLKIKHDSSNPFTIQGENYLIRDMGTQIEVRAGKDSTDVFVAEGSVYFASSRQQDKGIELATGNRGFLKGNVSCPVLRAKPSPNRLVWVTRQFHFQDTALPYVLANLSDYYHVHLTCNNKDKRLTGDFDAGSLETIVRFIEKTLDVRIYN